MIALWLIGLLLSTTALPANGEPVAIEPHLGLPQLAIPDNNPLTTEKIALGQALFFDRRLSADNTMSCAMCHIPDQGFSNNFITTPVGYQRRKGRRNAPTLLNVGYFTPLFHDGRAKTLEEQVWGPLLNHREMANTRPAAVIAKINQISQYRQAFDDAFKTPPSKTTLAQAIASFERTLIAGDSPFDRWYYGHQENAINKTAKKGFSLFSGKANCIRCHTFNKQTALLTDQRFHNTGIGTHGNKPNTLSLKQRDLGRFEITGNPSDRGRYKTPTLRNIALTKPYMHNGRLHSLEQVIHFYNNGGITNPELSPLIQPLHLSKDEINQLTAFLKALSSPHVAALIENIQSKN
ncbi:MAG TPA: c-type cytochrome [Methylococcaceae bacterium]|jgi:cytochrome c peroxidase|nr:c-type cytochrome [Methylococcaceae bacterium]